LRSPGQPLSLQARAMKVLIADDSEALVQRLTSKLLEITGVEIAGRASNVADAIQAIRQTKPDVLILDIRMPGGSGIDVLEALKEDPFPPIVIVLSNHGDRQYRRKCLQRGARFFFDKSVEFHKVSEVLRTLTDTAK